MTFKSAQPGVEEIEVETVERPGMTETVSRHPAFGQISISRSQGGKGVLYGSDFLHQHQITLRIASSELHRSLSSDRPFSRKELVEVTMSEAQWATFVSSMNMGSGVPCTLNQINGERFPAIPRPTDRAKQFRDEVSEDIQEMLDALKELEADIEGIGLSKTKIDHLRSKVRKARSKVESTIPFVAEQFSEHMEEEVEKAKMEVHGFVTGVAQQAGIKVIASGDFMALADHTEGGA